MPRIVSAWLPQWPVHRWLAAERRKPGGAPIDPETPFVIADGTDAPRIVALNPAARASGLAVGETLADARARIGFLQVRIWEHAADAKALAGLAQWATRYTPSVAVYKNENGTDGLFLDVTGATHLLGGEKPLLIDLAQRLKAFGLPVRLALAETAGTAWAVSHYARAPITIVSAGGEQDVLSPLPIEGLRLASETALTLRRLGFKRIGALIDKPRAPFAARFEKELLLRTDRALGRASEPLRFLAAPPVYVETRSLLEPISTEDAILVVAARLMQALVPKLEADGVGARNLRLSLYRVDGGVQRLDVGCTLPTQNPEHVTRLIRLRLERLSRQLEAGFGFETLSLAVTVAEKIDQRQHALATDSDETERERRCIALVDALRQRLGPESVSRLAPIASHWPERSEQRTRERSEKRLRERQTTESEPSATWTPQGTSLRPPLLFPRAEPADVIALMPDGPPQLIRWRGKRFTITHAEGPERIAPEWWRAREHQPTRDYYLVEDNEGRRLWLYREGIPGRETATPRWYVHGLFA